MNRYQIKICYDGTCYFGWQSQTDKPSIQGALEACIYQILQKKVSVSGSGRTDAKAHAYGQVAHFDVDSPLDTYRFLYSLNVLLPKDIRVLQISKVSQDFHARYSVRSKIYYYYVHTDLILSPFLINYRHHFPYPLDLKEMKKARDLLLGTHDFTSFSNTGSVNHRPTKKMKRIDIVEKRDGICLIFQADGFLYKMVRNIVGHLLQVATQKIPAQDTTRILQAKDRAHAPGTVPAKGLFLKQVLYPAKLLTPSVDKKKNPEPQMQSASDTILKQPSNLFS